MDAVLQTKKKDDDFSLFIPIKVQVLWSIRGTSVLVSSFIIYFFIKTDVHV